MMMKTTSSANEPTPPPHARLPRICYQSASVTTSSRFGHSSQSASVPPLAHAGLDRLGLGGERAVSKQQGVVGSKGSRKGRSCHRSPLWVSGTTAGVYISSTRRFASHPRSTSQQYHSFPPSRSFIKTTHSREYRFVCYHLSASPHHRIRRDRAQQHHRASTSRFE